MKERELVRNAVGGTSKTTNDRSERHSRSSIIRMKRSLKLVLAL